MITRLPMRYAVFIPCIFCLFLSIVALFDESLRPAFFVLLPVCFLQIAIVILRQQQEIQRLRELVAPEQMNG